MEKLSINLSDFGWKDTGPVLTTDMVTACEGRIQCRIPEGYAQFLLACANGGAPTGDWSYPVENLQGGADVLGYLYGISHPNKILDLDSAFSLYREVSHVYAWVSHLFPFATDGLGDFLAMAPDSSIYFVPHEDCAGNDPAKWFVANNLEEFFRHLRPE